MKINFTTALIAAGLSLSISACSANDTGVDADAGPDAVAKQDTSNNNNGELDVVVEQDTKTSFSDVVIERGLINELSYQSITTGCLSSTCGIEISINVVSERITRAIDGIGPPYRIEPDEAADFKARVLTEDTHAKMLSGWECPAANPDATTEYRFEGRVLIGDEYELTYRDITGCVESDAASVILLIEAFQELRFKYYPHDAD
ncbi:MAG: hypothetical protein H0U74_16105 [Bradymonadaceae bacterium]|nr:hypothetical protein [Lujinxingiaceae bacterium]